jgi:hypothetical protein
MSVFFNSNEIVKVSIDDCSNECPIYYISIWYSFVALTSIEKILWIMWFIKYTFIGN